MKDIDIKKMKSTVKSFKGKKVLVLGDIMLDKYIWGDVVRISPEAPVPVVEVKKDTSCLGGAGNVCRNLESLGAFPLLVGITGNDSAADWIKAHIPDSRGIFIDKKRPTSVKTRIVANRQQVVRVDSETAASISYRQAEKIFDFIKNENCDGILISDYNKGVITRSLMTNLLAYTQKNKIPVFVDPKIENFPLFSPITLITPNHHEAERIIHQTCKDDSEVDKAGEKIFQKITTKYIIIKRGERGMTVFEKGKRPLHIPSLAREVYDVSGAGDTVIATASLALLSGATILEAAYLANTAAGIVVGKIGTATASASELLNAL
ncbi:MAG: D-glycero-beta-D-manno-heptose-7-phosphate kinase [Candidatus Aminicenantes bacterium]|nr:D-glycero-beta-D-manno-heptose-7-phosphate kinase [Candidatus Aminicenantes bacterium]